MSKRKPVTVMIDYDASTETTLIVKTSTDRTYTVKFEMSYSEHQDIFTPVIVGTWISEDRFLNGVEILYVNFRLVVGPDDRIYMDDDYRRLGIARVDGVYRSDSMQSKIQDDILAIAEALNMTSATATMIDTAQQWAIKKMRDEIGRQIAKLQDQDVKYIYMQNHKHERHTRLAHVVRRNNQGPQR